MTFYSKWVNAYLWLVIAMAPYGLYVMRAFTFDLHMLSS